MTPGWREDAGGRARRPKASRAVDCCNGGWLRKHLSQLLGKGGILLVHNSMLKPSRSIKMLTFMLLAAVGRLDGDKRVEERRRNCCKGCCARSSTKD